ncbi:MAG: L-threonylcarbamoyladenylate synthase [Algibacter sp.]|uniref:L-threonylcarbamoyladenylate synthase n=1 Tax=Algibacter sp. TaxID=1872428 RepID=UPI002621AB2C|nr:L-threonylcarbamoyladenylate synthase [Algibacter sp.]MDG1731096.1 L-threonylcarbamoyladenylate synthase [Algibacter sp.]MDG2177480.1 L-threonylcarbamoyladenylate synthase [Algibacter sp.]
MSIISKDIQKAVALLKADKLVAIPTETVYGLAGNIYSEKAIKSIFATKKRPFFNPLIVHMPSVESLETIVSDVPEKAKLLADAFWPGSMTLVLKKQSSIPDIITAGKDTVAVRVPNHPVTLELLKQLPFPLAAPSANPFGSISPTKPEHVARYFKNDIEHVLDGGACINGIESTIIGFEDDEPIIYRLGALALEDIEAVIGKVSIKNKKEESPDAPGMLDRHYAPATQTFLTDTVSEDIKKHLGKRIGILLFKSDMKDDTITTQIILSQKGDMAEAASKLYDALHELDHQNLDVIIAEKFPNYGLGKSINDRLQRATFSI